MLSKKSSRFVFKAVDLFVDGLGKNTHKNLLLKNLSGDILFLERILRQMKKVISSLLDALFPPICSLCEKEAQELLCSQCQEHLAPPDPALRCSHCFAELEEETVLCRQCVRAPILAAPRAFLFELSSTASCLRAQLAKAAGGPLGEMAAALLVWQWGRLNWPMPNRISVVPSLEVSSGWQFIAQEAASMLGKTLSIDLNRQMQLKSSDVLQGEEILLVAFEERGLKEALTGFWSAFPKRIYIVSLFEKAALEPP